MILVTFLIGFVGGIFVEQGVTAPQPNDIIVHAYIENNGFNKVCK